MNSEERLIAAFLILECKPGSSPEEVRASYRQLVKVWHPDRFQSDEKLRIKATEKMKAIIDAYHLLEPLSEEVERLNRLGKQSAPTNQQSESSDTNPIAKEPDYKTGTEATVVTEKYDSKSGRKFFKKVVEKTVGFDGRWLIREKTILQTRPVDQQESFENAAKQSMSFSLPRERGTPREYWEGTLDGLRGTERYEHESESGHDNVFEDGSSIAIHRTHTDTWFHDDEKKATNGRKSSKLADLQESHAVYASRGDWPSCFEITKRIVELHRQETWGWLKRSEALRYAGLEQEAYRALIPAADLFIKQAEIPYTLACYAARLGDLLSAKSWLQRTFDVAALEGPYSSLFEHYQNLVRREPDLGPIAGHIPNKPLSWTLRKYFGV